MNEWPLAWWRHQMETLSALLALCAGNSTDTGELTSQMPVARSFDVFVDLRLKWLSKQSWGWLFETPSRSLWRHCNGKSLYYSLSSRTKIVSKIPYNRYRYNVVHYSTILHTALQWLKLKMFLVSFSTYPEHSVYGNPLTPLSIMLAGPTYPVANRLAKK